MRIPGLSPVTATSWNCHPLLRGRPDDSEFEATAYEAFFASLVERVYSSLRHCYPQPLPELQIHAWHGAGEKTRKAYRDANDVYLLTPADLMSD